MKHPVYDSDYLLNVRITLKYFCLGKQYNLGTKWSWQFVFKMQTQLKYMTAGNL